MTNEPTPTPSDAARALARIRTPRRAAASAENGRKGARSEEARAKMREAWARRKARQAEPQKD